MISIPSAVGPNVLNGSLWEPLHQILVAFEVQDCQSEAMWIWNWLEANAGVVEALATVVAAVVAVVGIWIAVSDAKNRNAPVVIALFRRAKDNYFAIEFVVKNFGQTPARKVKMKFDPGLSADKSDGTMGYLLPRRYSKELSILAPGQELSNVWFYPKIVGNRVEGNRTTLPDSTKVTIEYRGNRLRSFKETFELDLSVVKEGSDSVSSDSLPGRMKSIDKSLKDMVGHARAAARAASGIEDALTQESDSTGSTGERAE